MDTIVSRLRDIAARACLALREGVMAYGMVTADPSAWLHVRSSARADLEMRGEATRGVAQLEAYLSRR